MQVFLNFPLNSENSLDFNSFIILEFQGKIECSQDELDGLELGDLTNLSENTFSIKIGNHICEGIRTKLNSPMIITKSQETENKNERILTITGVCREKILFNKRPTPIFDPKYKKIKDTATDNIFYNAKRK